MYVYMYAQCTHKKQELPSYTCTSIPNLLPQQPDLFKRLVLNLEYYIIFILPLPSPKDNIGLFQWNFCRPSVVSSSFVLFVYVYVLNGKSPKIKLKQLAYQHVYKTRLILFSYSTVSKRNGTIYRP